MQAAAAPLNPRLDINFKENEHEVFTFGAISQKQEDKTQFDQSPIRNS